MAHAKINLSRMFEWIERNLELDVAQPTDADIMERFGFDNAESARTLLAELADAGRITIKGYGDARAITLGRIKSALTPAARPMPAAKRSDPAVEQAAATIAAIVARGPKPGSPIVASPKPVSKPTPAPAPRQEKPAMPKPEPVAAKRAITFTAEGDLLRTIERTAEANDLPLGRVAIDLIAAGLATPVQAVPAPVEFMSIDQLLARIKSRFEGVLNLPDRSDEVAALTARAETAERKLEALRAALA